MSYENVKVAKEGRVAIVTIDRPKALNALNTQTVIELMQVPTDLEVDDEVHCVILTGGGEKAFVAGADIAEMQQMRMREARRFSQGGHALMTSIESSHRPWIAAVNGFALGGGCELALACDFIYAAKTARFGQPEVNLGVMPGFGGTQRLMRRVGVAKAKELVFTGDVIGAEEAHRIGLVDGLFEAADLMPAARKTAEKIAQKGPLAVAEAKRAMLEGQSVPLDQANLIEANGFASLFDTSYQKEGMKAFLEKRPAKFEGK